MGFAAVRLDDDAVEDDPAIDDPGVAANRCATGAVEDAEKGALGREGDGGVAVVDGGKEVAGLAVIAPRDDGDGALANRGQPVVGVHQAGDVAGQAEALKPGVGEERGRGLAAGELGQTGLDIAAEIDDGEVGPETAGERHAAEG